MSSRASTESPSVFQLLPAWGLFLLPYLFLGILPVSLSWWLADSALSIAREQAVQASVETSRQEICRALVAAEPAPLVGRHLARLKDQIFQRRPDPKKLKALLPALAQRWGCSFETWLFNDRGEPVLIDDQKPEFRPMMISLWDALSNRRPLAGEYLDSINDLRGLFGDQFAPLLLKRMRGRVINLVNVGNQKVSGRRSNGSPTVDEPGLFFWDFDPYSRFGGVMFLVRQLPVHSAFLKTVLPHTGLASSTLFFISVANKNLIMEGRPVLEDVQKNVLADFTLRERSWKVIGDTLWIMLSQGDFVCYVGSPFDAASHELKRRNLLILVFLLLIGSCGLFHSMVVRTRSGSIAIRSTLFLMLLFAFLIPLGSGFLYAAVFLETSIPRMENAIRERGEEILQRFANTKAVIRDAQKSLEGTLRTFLRKLERSPGTDEFFQALEAGQERRLYSEYRLFDANGEPVSTSPDGSLPEAGSSETEKFWRTLANLTLREKGGNRAASESLATSEGTVASFPVFKIEMGDLRELARRSGRMSLLAIQGADQMFWDFFQAPFGRTAVAFFRSRLDHTLEHYLQRVFSHRESFGSYAFRFMFCLNDLMVRYPLEMPFPRHFAELHRMALMMAKISRRLLFRPTSWNGQACYVLAASSVVFDNSVLFIIYPQAPVREFLDQEKSRMILYFLLAIPLGIGFSWLLACFLEVPIANLGILQTMKHRLSGFDLVGISNANPAGVTAAFDSIIENLGEINSARTIQEQLFPLNVLSLSSYQAFGISKPARDLGGDYFDYQVVSKDKLLVVVGDVTGHGIPAALVVSMAKAVVTDFARSIGGHPSDLLDRLDQMLHESVKKKRYMTLALLWIDTKTHEAQYFNCGHPYPILARSNGETGFLAGRGFFLGREIKVPRMAITFTLNPGDRFIFYTDGLVESLDPPKHVDAFEAFLDYVRSHGRGLPVQETCRTLFQQHPHFASGKPQPDDFTLVVVERLPEA